MRQLTREEKRLTERNLKRQNEEIDQLRKNREYNLDMIGKQNFIRLLDDKWRDFLREQKDQEDKKVISMIDSEIENRESTVKIAKSQINQGVEEKKNPLIQ